MKRWLILFITLSLISCKKVAPDEDVFYSYESMIFECFNNPISPFATSTYEITASQPGVYIFGATDGTCGSVTYIKTGKKTARLIFISSIYSTTFRDEYVLTFRTRKSGKYEYYRNSTFYEKGRFKFVDRDKF